IISPLLGIAMYVAQRLVKIVMLYIISPVSFGMYPVDDGHAKTEWYKDMKGALLGGILMMIMLEIFVVFAAAINQPIEYKDNEVIKGILIVAGNPLMDGIVKAVITGAGVGMLIELTQQILKYLGCEDKLLTSVKSASPARALKAIGQGVKNTVKKIKEKHGGGEGKEDSSKESGEAGATSDLEGRAKNMAKSRQKYIQGRANSDSGESKTSNSKSNDDKWTSNKTMSRVKRNSGVGRMRPIQNQESIAKSSKDQSNIVGKTKLRGDNKQMNKEDKDKKSGKGTEAFSAALEKFAKRLEKIFKQPKDEKGKKKENIKKERRVNQNVINKLDTNNKNNVNVKVKKGDNNKKIKIDKNINTNVKNKINNMTKVKDDNGAMRAELNGVKSKIGENIAKLRKINTHIIGLPRKVSKEVNSKIKK
ncbi:MAG: hypothetical protein RR348_01175, partial [Clostridia bacterium]